MSRLKNCDDQLHFLDLARRFSVSLTEVQWIVLERRFIYGETLETIGGILGMARVRVSHILSNSLEVLITIFQVEIECFSLKLEKLLTDTGGALTIAECLIEFPEISEAEFIILFAACQKKREGIFFREEELVSLK